MGKIEFADVPSDWTSFCAQQMVSDEARTSLTKSLLKKWTGRFSKPADRFLNPRNLDSLGFPWSMLLSFAISQRDFPTMARSNLVGAFEDALLEFEPDLTKGLVWLTDVLALRFLRYSPDDAEVSLRAMELMLSGLEVLPAKMPKNNRGTYNRFNEMYSAVAECLVVEPFEPETVRDAFIAGARLQPDFHQTLFQNMSRLAEEGSYLALDEVAGLEIESRSEFRIAELKQWASFASRRQELVNNLFLTLCAINRDFSLQVECRMPGDALPAFSADAVYSLARELDVAWFRLAHVSNLEPNRHLAINYIKQVRTGDESLFPISATRLTEPRPTFANTLQVEFVDKEDGQIKMELFGEAKEQVEEVPPMAVAG